MNFATADDIRKSKAPPRAPREPRGPRHRLYRVEAWAMPDPHCRDQKARYLLHPAQEVSAGSPDEARSVYLANYPVPPAFLADRHRIGPLVIIRVSGVGGES